MAKMTGKEAVKISGRSESWLRRHECAWCNQILWNALLYGCAAQHEQCEPTKKNFGQTAMPEHTRPFYGAECPSYPACDGGCGLGCTKEIERPLAPAISHPPENIEPGA